jgi:hypothetical protein
VNRPAAEIGAIVELGGEPAGTARAVEFLREQAGADLTVGWRGRLAGPLDLTLLHHLPPPEALEGADGPAEAACWREAYRLGACHFRRGPGFIQVKDSRDPRFTAKFMLDEPGLVAAFTTCLRPTSLAELGPALRDAALTLHRERLLLLIGDLAVTLPTRMLRWPVPCHAV